MMAVWISRRGPAWRASALQFGAGALLLLGLGCGAGEHPTWRLDQIHAAAPLSGIHATLRCSDCHDGDPYSQVPKRCYDCHRTAFETSSFDHTAFGGSIDCAACHTTAGWSPATFDHGAFRFPLTGKHTEVACRDCHLDGVWAGQPVECKACHWTRRQDDPWRLALGETCDSCHVTSGWSAATFDHLGRTGFALEGAHARISCVSCHPNYQPSGIPAGCNDCHSEQRQSAGHPAFATDCADCHTVTAWTPSTFDHEPAFPIRQGRHSGFTCVYCHTGTTFQDFTCLTCHLRAETDPEHREVQRYVYNSPACYDCHPRGTGEDL